MKPVLIVALLLASASISRAAPPPVGRQDLGLAWMRMERALRDHPPKPEVRKRLGDAFDVKTMAFFRGGFREVVRGIDSITAELRGVSAVEGPAAFAMAYRVKCDPPVWVIGRDTTSLAMRCRTIYDVKVTKETLVAADLELRLITPGGKTLLDVPGDATAMDGQAALYKLNPKPGVHEFRLVGKGIDETVGRLTVMTRPPHEIRAANQKRISALPKDAPPRAVVCVRARNALIVAKPHPGQSYAWISDPHTLSVEVDAEITALEKGVNPYRGRKGDQWRIVSAKGDAVPFRIFVPGSVGEKPVPLLVALHGAGADENALFEGYGAGLIKELAAKHGFIVVAPRTMSVARKPGAFITLLDTIAADHAIDPARVYVLGHSLGGMATGLLARAHPDRITACCQIAGGFGRTGKNGPPILFIHAGRDRVVRMDPPPASDLITVKSYPDEAHTFVVPVALPGAIDWLLAHPKKK